MIALEGTGTSSEIKEQYEEIKKFVGRGFSIFLLFKGKMGRKRTEVK